MEKYLLGTQRVTEQLGGVSTGGSSKSSAEEAAKFGALLRSAAFGLAAKSLSMGEDQDAAIPARSERIEQPERSRPEREARTNEREQSERAERPDRSEDRDAQRSQSRDNDRDAAPEDRKTADRDQGRDDDSRDHGRDGGSGDNDTARSEAKGGDQSADGSTATENTEGNAQATDAADSSVAGKSAEIINTLIDGADATTVVPTSGKAAAQATQATQTADGKANDVTGLQQAADQAANTGNQSNGGTQDQGRNANGENRQGPVQQQNATPEMKAATSDTADQTAAPERLRQNTHAVDPAKQPQQQAQNTGRTVDDVPVEALSAQAKQAQDLTKRTGGQHLKVDVQVTNEAGKVVSKPVQAPTMTESAETSTGKAEGAKANAQAMPGTQAAQVLAANAANNQQQAQQGLQNAQAQLAARAGGNAAQAAATGTGAQAAPTGDAAQGATGQSFQQQVQQQTKATEQAAPKHVPHQRPQLVDQVNVRISKMVQEGQDRINIQLRPASLGRIDVQLEVNADGRVQAVVTAETRNTLDMLQQDHRELIRALQQAGLNADQNSLNFQLKGEQGEANRSGGHAGGQDGEDDGMDALPELAAQERKDIITKDRIDVRA